MSNDLLGISYWDWLIIAAFFVFAIGLALYHTRRATSGLENYFASGRNASWWLLGTSMVATTFAADTPLAVSGWVAKSISMNWYWWGWAMSTLLGVFFFSRLWRRSGVLTDTELAEVRYDGAGAGFLRGFRAVYFSLLFNCIVIGWVNLAMTKILENTMDIPKWQALAFCFAFSLVYTMLAGLTGVMATDLVQFALAMFGAVFLAVVAVGDIGGLGAIHGKLIAVHGAERAREITSIFPAPGSKFFYTVLCFVCFQWWAAQNTDSGGYLAQRMLSAKDEKNSFFGALWFNIAFYCLRPWPWILVGLVAVIKFANIPDPETGYILVMKDVLPMGMLGLMLATFFAAYMSTIDTHLNWGASYVVNDFYKRFIVRDGTQRHYVKVSLIATVFIALAGAGVTWMMSSIEGAWYIVTKLYAGLGVIWILRWYWWRINAYSEIAAMFGALIGTIVFGWYFEGYVAPGAEVFTFPYVLFLIVPMSLIFAFIATVGTDPVSEKKLIGFYRKVRPGGIGWKRIRKLIPGTEKDQGPSAELPAYLVSAAAVYCVLFGTGKLLLGPAWVGYLLLGIAAALGLILWRMLSVKKWELAPLPETGMAIGEAEPEAPVISKPMAPSVILVYIASFLIPFFGLVIGANFRNSRVEENRSVGRACSRIGGIVTLCAITFAAFTVIALFAGGPETQELLRRLLFLK